jgi:hypothetical protein
VRLIITLFLLSAWLTAQTAPPSPQQAPPQKPDSASQQNNPPQDGSPSTPIASSTPAASTLAAPPAAGNPNTVTVPAGTKLALELKHAISTKGTQEGAAVYAQTTFPFALNDRILIPAGTYVQGRISHIERGGHIKGRAEVLMHFTTLIYPSGYTVVLPGSLENAPGVDKAAIKDKEGTLRQDSQAGEEATTIASGAGSGAVVGALSNGAKGGLIGAGVGGAVGTAIALLGRGRDVNMPSGTTFEMLIQRDVPIDSSRISAAGK